MANNLTISPIVDVVVEVTNLTAPRDGFNVGLIVGLTPIIDIAERCKEYTGTEGMLEDGFNAEDPEYKAAALYFIQIRGIAGLFF